MRPRRDLTGGLLALLLGLFAAGLVVSAQDDDEKPVKKVEKKPAAKAPKENAAAKRKTVAGNWFLVASPEDQHITLGVLKITLDGDKAEGELLTMSEQFSAAELKSLSAKDGAVQLTLDALGREFVFSGKLSGGNIRGEMVIQGNALPTKLEATEANNLKGRRGATPVEGAAELQAALADGDPKAIGAWIDANPENPLALAGAQQALGALEGVSAEDAKKFADRYVEIAAGWGPTLETQAHAAAAQAFAENKDYHELALAHLEAVEKSGAPDSLKESLLPTKANLLLAMGKQEEGLALAEKVLEKNPNDAAFLVLLARNAEETKDIDRAIDLYAKIATVPLLERRAMQAARGKKGNVPPSEALAKLWEAKHGDVLGLEKFLDEAYEKAILVVKPERAPARKEGEGNRVALFELFTGQACPPCVAADVATTILEHAYAPTEVIVLRYHQHIPAPDPLANTETRERFEAYQGQGTPTLVANGNKLEAGGFMEHVAPLYEQLKEAADKILKESTDVAIDVSAKAQGRKLVIAASASGIPKDATKLRLRLALAEEKIPFKARNGIRSHEMIVRSMPGGVQGVVADDDGKLAYSGDVDIDELQDGLSKDIAAKEEEMQSEFEVKPLDLKTFRVVAFVQDDKTGEILQARAVEVEGKLAPGKPPVAKKDLEEPPEEEVEKPAPKKPAPKKKAAPK